MLVFIPARSGSKGIKNKNLVKINGKPLIYYTLQICKFLRKKHDIFISTDSYRIRNYCAKQGFRTNYIRPKKLSTDTISIVDAIFHGVNWYHKNNQNRIKDILLLQPTSPLRKLTDVNKAINLYKKNKLDSLVSVTPMREHPYESVKYDIKKNKWNYIEKQKNFKNSRQQYKNNFYYIDGSLYLSSLKHLRKYKKFVQKNITKLFFINQKYNIDIDDYEDLILAETLIKKIK
tara:strand:+ start:94 stop:789 length:696 start_codon:yes stop_codon:yes gene_type:complete